MLVSLASPSVATGLQYTVSDTEDVINYRGLPDYRVPANSGEDEHLLLYDASDSPDGDIDYAYLVDEKDQIEGKIVLLEEEPHVKKRNSRSENNWLRDTIEELRSTVKTLKETRDSMNRSVHALPGFNQFDEVEVIDDEMTFRLGQKEDRVLTTLVYEPRKDWVSLTFRVPFGD